MAPARTLKSFIDVGAKTRCASKQQFLQQKVQGYSYVVTAVPLAYLQSQWLALRHRRAAQRAARSCRQYRMSRSVGSRSMFGAQPHSKRPSAPAYGFGGMHNDKVFLAAEEGQSLKRVDKVKDHGVPAAPPAGRPTRPGGTLRAPCLASAHDLTTCGTCCCRVSFTTCVTHCYRIY